MEHDTERNGSSKVPWIRSAGRVFAVLITVAVMVALARSLRREAPEALTAWRAAHVRWEWITLACACGAAGQALWIVGWRRLLSDSGLALSLWDTTRIYLASNLGRYVPGAKAWQMGIVGVMASERGLPGAAVAATSLLQGTVGMVVGALLLVATGSAALGISPAWLVVAAAGVAGLLAAPALLQRMPAVRRLLPQVERVSAGTMWAMIWTSAASWLAWGLGLYALARGLLHDPGTSVWAYVAAWIGPFMAGILAVVAPAGLGVRDAAMKAALDAAGVDPGGVVVVVVVARLWITVLEVVPALTMLAIRRRAGNVRITPLSSALTLALLGAIGACSGEGHSTTTDYGVILPFDTARVRLTTRADTLRLLVELAATPDQRTLGLMERRALPDSAGMLFLYSTTQPASDAFWMYRTRIPLDIAFIDSMGTIRTIHSMEPCQSLLAQGCPSYPAGAPFRAALEVNAGYFSRHKVQPGDHVLLRDTANRVTGVVRK
jgi:uncharacterized membrane protein (UPF0127 family)/uncharacterized membrane protein YbhN (UPF0104 family)